MSAGSYRMRILFVEYGLGFGGSIVSLSELARGLEATGRVEPLVASAYQESDVRSLLGSIHHTRRTLLLDYGTRARFTRVVSGSPAPIRWLLMKAYAVADSLVSLLNSRSLVAVIRQHDIDVVHINNGWADDAVRAAKWANVPAVCHYRGFPNKDFPSSVAGSAGRGATVRAAIAISAAVQESLRNTGIPEEILSVVYNPIRLDRYDAGRSGRDRTRAELSADEHAVVVSMFGRVTPWKGQAEFLEAMCSVAARCPRLVVVIVGDESDSDAPDYLARVRQAAASMPPGSVVFAGYQPDVERFYWASDVVVHNSIEPEPFGRVVSEAMACERAVVAMDEGGPAEIITSGTDGLLVPPRDLPSLAAAVERLYNDAEFRESLGKEARKTVVARFSNDAIARQVLEVYSKAGLLT